MPASGRRRSWFPGVGRPPGKPLTRESLAYSSTPSVMRAARPAWARSVAYRAMAAGNGPDRARSRLRRPDAGDTRGHAAVYQVWAGSQPRPFRAPDPLRPPARTVDRDPATGPCLEPAQERPPGACHPDATSIRRHDRLRRTPTVRCDGASEQPVAEQDACTRGPVTSPVTAAPFTRRVADPPGPGHAAATVARPWAPPASGHPPGAPVRRDIAPTPGSWPRPGADA